MAKKESKTENKPASLELIKAKVGEMMKFRPEKIVLGCTHYPYLTEQLGKYAPAELFINPAESFVNYIKKDLEKLNLLTDKTTEGFEKIYVSANPEQFMAAGSMFYEVKELPELVK